MNPVPVAAERNTKTAVAASHSLRLQTLAGAIAFFSNMRRLVFLPIIGFALKCSAEDLPMYRTAALPGRRLEIFRVALSYRGASASGGGRDGRPLGENRR